MLLLVATGAAATEIEPGIYRIEGLGDSLPKDDLEPLAGIVGKAELVGLGEAVHTSGDFYRAKFRIFRYLVEELGFRVTFSRPGISFACLSRKIRFPDARTAVWAHNFRLARGKANGIETMGLHLKRAFKRKYKAIGLIAFEASIDWVGVGCGLFATAEPGSVEDLLRQLGEPLLLVDLAFPGGDPPFLRKGRKYDFNWGVAPDAQAPVQRAGLPGERDEDAAARLAPCVA